MINLNKFWPCMIFNRNTKSYAQVSTDTRGIFCISLNSCITVTTFHGYNEDIWPVPVFVIARVWLYFLFLMHFKMVHVGKTNIFFCFFQQSFSGVDQRNLLLANTDMLVNIKSARMLKPGVNLKDQVCGCIYAHCMEVLFNCFFLLRDYLIGFFIERYCKCPNFVCNPSTNYFTKLFICVGKVIESMLMFFSRKQGCLKSNP
jgi:hypothetical protein